MSHYAIFKADAKTAIDQFCRASNLNTSHEFPRYRISEFYHVEALVESSVSTSLKFGVFTDGRRVGPFMRGLGRIHISFTRLRGTG